VRCTESRPSWLERGCHGRRVDFQPFEWGDSQNTGGRPRVIVHGCTLIGIRERHPGAPTALGNAVCLKDGAGSERSRQSLGHKTEAAGRCLSSPRARAEIRRARVWSRPVGYCLFAPIPTRTVRFLDWGRRSVAVRTILRFPSLAEVLLGALAESKKLNNDFAAIYKSDFRASTH
jgi:hypothetical protein